jgi:transposase InsO family protein
MYYGPEYVSAALSARAQRRGIHLEFIQPGKPQQNAYVERYNRTVRYDWLAHYLFYNGLRQWMFRRALSRSGNRKQLFFSGACSDDFMNDWSSFR